MDDATSGCDAEMRPWRLTVGLLAAAVLLLVAVPRFRRFVAQVAHPPHGVFRQTAYEAVALAHPQDAQMWLGYAELAQSLDSMRSAVQKTSAARQEPQESVFGPPAKTTAADAYAEAVSLTPDSAATQFRYALCLAASGDDAKAAEAFRRCRDLAPDNAACDCFLLSALLQQGKVAEVPAVCADTLRKTTWRQYEPEAGAARFRVLDSLAGRPSESAVFSTSDYRTLVQIGALTRGLAGLGDSFRSNGNHRQAILCYETLVHLGHLIRANAFGVTEGLMGVSMTGLAAGGLLSQDERKAADAMRDSDARSEYLRKARTAAFTGYLKSHGRGDLADLYVRDEADAAAWRKASRAVPNMIMDAVMDSFYGRGVATAGAVWVTTALLALLLVVAGLVSVATRCWRRPVPGGPSWAYLDWLALLAALLLPGAAIGAFFDIRGQTMRAWIFLAEWAIPIASGLGLLAWLRAVTVGSRRWRRALAPDERPGRVRCLIASLGTLGPPTFAAMLLLSVVALWPVSGEVDRSERFGRTLALQGDIKYFHVNEAAEAFEAGKQPPPVEPFR